MFCFWYFYPPAADGVGTKKKERKLNLTTLARIFVRVVFIHLNQLYLPSSAINSCGIAVV